VSKTSYVAALVLAVWLLIAWRWSAESVMMNAGLVVAGIAATVFGCWYIKQTQDFAERNPGQALLDGAEFLEYSRLGSASKSLPSPPPDQTTAKMLPNSETGE
jgi:hypothetical protein